ncbi:hypothetical protein VMCG_03210 [Cytospora schulzeri]|uniref:Uncharacterized protein n=1 Tax=Cytospora schulzeri TaxID=448051 RepID=A0A423WYA5_9PEZI|nr:hypothetical protein VMCG_03210 [Valsa malicola]
MPPPQGTSNFLEGPGQQELLPTLLGTILTPDKLTSSILAGRAVYTSGGRRAQDVCYGVQRGNSPADAQSEPVPAGEAGEHEVCGGLWMLGLVPGACAPVFVDTPQIGADTTVYLTSEKRQWLNGRYVNCTWDMPELLAQE